MVLIDGHSDPSSDVTDLNTRLALNMVVLGEYTSTVLCFHPRFVNVASAWGASLLETQVFLHRSNLGQLSDILSPCLVYNDDWKVS